MSRKCRKCGGSGDMFVLQYKSGQQIVENWKEFQRLKKICEIHCIATLECSLCGGYGKEDL